MASKISKISDILTKEQKAAKEFIAKTREDLTLKSLLKQAKAHEAKKEYRKALNAYFKFLELRLKVIKERPQETLQQYFKLIPYYLKIAECYKKTKHLRPEDRIVDMEKAAKYHQKAAEMSLEQKDFSKAHSYYESASKTYQEIEEYGQAAMSYVKISEMYLKKGNLLMASTAYVRAGELYDQGNNFDDSGKVYIKAANLNIKLKNSREAGINYGKAGDSYQKLRNYKEAIKFYLKASEIASELEHYEPAAEMYQKVALSYEKLKDYDTGIHYYLKSAQLGSKVIGKSSYAGVGRCYESLKSFQKAIEYCTKAAKLSLEQKQNLEGALFYRDIARCYENLGEKEKAANFYSQYAELGKEDETTKEGYETASQIYLELAKKSLSKKEDKALGIYEKAAECYQNLDQKQKAAEIFQKIAEINLKKDSYGGSIKAYSQAGKFYEKSNQLEQAALSFYRSENYKKAGEVYLNSAYQKEREGNLFSAGKDYQKAGNCYGKLKEDSQARENYNKAVHTYQKHLDKIKYLSLKKDEEGNNGETHQKIGESYILMNKLPAAKKNLEKSSLYFKENKLKKRADLAEALLLRVKADLAVRQGDYENASQFLTTSISLLETSLQEKHPREYRQFLEKIKAQSEKIVQEIGKKPEVTLLLDRHSYTFVDTPVVINALLKNQVNQEVQDLNFLTHLPDELEATFLPLPIKKLKAKETTRNSLEVLPKKVGEYRLSPLEVYYQDKEGNKYVKASNKVTLKVVEKPSMDYKDYRITVNTFLKYAETQLKNKNYFHAGEGFWGVAETYGRFNEDIFAKENYQKAIQHYLKYAEELLKEKNLNIAKLHSLADTYKRVGQSNEKIQNLKDAEGAYQESIKYYEKTKLKAVHEEKLRLQYQLMNTQAFLSKVQAKFSITHGDYDKAQKLLENSLKLLEESVKKGDFGKAEEKFLEKNQRECQALLKEIKGKPQISLELKYSTKAASGTPLPIQVKITNKWDEPIFNLKFLLALPLKFKLKNKLETIGSLKPGKSIQVPLELIPQKAGEYKFKPFDLTYGDEKGNNYMKGCEQLHLRVK